MKRNPIHPEGAFGANFKSSIDWSEFTNERIKRQLAREQREARQARGDNGTIFGLSAKSDEEIAKRGRISKTSQLG